MATEVLSASSKKLLSEVVRGRLLLLLVAAGCGCGGRVLFLVVVGHAGGFSLFGFFGSTLCDGGIPGFGRGGKVPLRRLGVLVKVVILLLGIAELAQPAGRQWIVGVGITAAAAAHGVVGVVCSRRQQGGARRSAVPGSSGHQGSGF